MQKLMTITGKQCKAGMQWVVALLAAGMLTGCFGDGPKPTPAAGTTKPKRYEADILQVGENLRITLSGITKETADKPIEQRIKDDGTINLELIGSVPAAGRKVGDLQQDIHDRYVPHYYTRLNVLVQYENRFIFVNGHVKLPNRLVYVPNMTVLKAIASAGGFDDYADQSGVTVTRADGTVEKVDCKKALKRPELDLPVYPDDKVQVDMRFW